MRERCVQQGVCAGAAQQTDQRCRQAGAQTVMPPETSMTVPLM